MSNKDENIVIGAAKLVVVKNSYGHTVGWAQPGGAVIRDYDEAVTLCRRMSYAMGAAKPARARRKYEVAEIVGGAA